MGQGAGCESRGHLGDGTTGKLPRLFLEGFQAQLGACPSMETAGGTRRGLRLACSPTLYLFGCTCSKSGSRDAHNS